VEALRADRASLDAMVDDEFGDAAFDLQRHAILERVLERRDGGRVLTFPPREPRAVRRDRPAVRWLAAAAVAGLLIGMLAGQRLHPVLSSPTSGLFGASHESAVRRASRPAAARPSVAGADPVLVRAHDEVFLSEMEAALNNRGIPELRALDDLTPRASTSRGR